MTGIINSVSPCVSKALLRTVSKDVKLTPAVVPLLKFAVITKPLLAKSFPINSIFCHSLASIESPSS